VGFGLGRKPSKDAAQKGRIRVGFQSILTEPDTN
jgi:hypothetical protein